MILNSAVFNSTVFKSHLHLKLRSLPTLITQALIVPGSKMEDGTLIEAVTLPWHKILKLIMSDHSLMYEIDSRKWEEFIAGAYKDAGWDDVILTPRSGDHGRDVIAVKSGIGSVRFIESVKRYAPDHRVDAIMVRELGFALQADHNATRGIISTTSEFAPGIENDPLIKPHVPHRIELIDGKRLIERFAQWSSHTKQNTRKITHMLIRQHVLGTDRPKTGNKPALKAPRPRR